jgi:hypothetical protein
MQRVGLPIHLKQTFLDVSVCRTSLIKRVAESSGGPPCTRESLKLTRTPPIPEQLADFAIVREK